MRKKNNVSIPEWDVDVIVQFVCNFLPSHSQCKKEEKAWCLL